MVETETEPQETPVDARPEPGGSAAAWNEAMRREAVARLSENLSLSTDLLAWCERTAPKGRRMEALFAASRVMGASAQMAKALAELVQVERRKRTIVERIEAPRRIWSDSNSNPVAREIDALTERLVRHMNKVARETFDKAEPDAKPAAEAKPA